MNGSRMTFIPSLRRRTPWRAGAVLGLAIGLGFNPADWIQTFRAQAAPSGQLPQSDPPRNLVASVTGTTVTLTWQPSAGGTWPDGYLVEAAITPSGNIVASIHVPAPSLVVPGVPAGVYHVRVRASSAGGLSPPSNEVVIVVPGSGTPCTSAPDAPRNLSASISGSLVSMAWLPPAGGCAATSYLLHVGSAPSSSNLAQVTLSGTTLASMALPGKYYVRVSAGNAFGIGPPSNEVTVMVGGPAPTPGYGPYRALMAQVLARGPLYVTSGPQVSQGALGEAASMLETMLSNREDVGAELRRAGAITAIFGRSETSCDLPYFADLAGTTSCTLGGLGGVPGRPATACAERNLLRAPDDPFRRGRIDGENVCVHELAHTVMNVGLGDAERQHIRARYAAARSAGLWGADYAMTNADEFFAEMTQAYFCANPDVRTFNHMTGVNCADRLRAYDLETWQLLQDIYRGSADLR